MLLNLIEPETEYHRNLIDWNDLTNLLCSDLHFDLNKHLVSRTFLTKGEVIRTLEIQAALLPDLDSLFASKIEHLKLLRPEQSPFERVKMLDKEVLLNLDELNYCALAVSAYDDLYPYFAKYYHQVNIASLIHFQRSLRQFVEPSGEVHFSQHPKLRDIQDKIDTSSRQMRQLVLQLAKSELYSQSLAFDQYDVINERFVLAVRADHYTSRHGAILSRSQSGQTLFVEPFVIRDEANARIELIAQRDEILNNIILSYNRELRTNTKELLHILHVLHEMDLHLAKARFSQRLELQPPNFSDGAISIQDLRHPLIKNAVSNHIELNEQTQGLLLSGPNTGGKTVTLKTLALTMMFSRIGCGVPASQATFPFPEKVFFFSQDQQNIKDGMSSFSSEADQYLRLFHELGINSYIFIDEIFNTTSSEEASALAIALIEVLTSAPRQYVFVSSHHNKLKSHFHQTQHMTSAHVGYDQQKSCPTYKIIIGSPGASMAVPIFKGLATKHGIGLTLVERANQLLESRQTEYEEMVSKLNDEHTRLSEQRAQTERLNKDLREQLKASEGLLFLERQKVLDEFDQQMKKKIQEAERVIESLKSGEISTKKAPQMIKSISTAFKPSSQGQQPLGAPLTQVEPGQTAYCDLTKTQVMILSVNDRKAVAQVTHGRVQLWVPYASLYASGGAPQKTKERTKVYVERSSPQKIELDARGMRLEEFISSFEVSLTDLMTQDIPYLTVVHGHGEGILKSWLRNFLKTNKDLVWSTHEGNDGATIIKLASE